MGIIDYKYKSFVLKTNMHKYIGFLDKSWYLFCNDGIVPKLNLEDEYNKLSDEYGTKFIKECHRINQANFKLIQRLKERIERYVIMGNAIFLTLTFDNNTLVHTSVETRRKYVQRCLKDNSDYYVANIDFGADDRYTHREHYHALVVCDKFDKKTWKYGFSYCERIYQTSSELKIAKYIAKLCNHAIKESTKRACYIYSRR